MKRCWTVKPFESSQAGANYHEEQCRNIPCEHSSTLKFQTLLSKVHECTTNHKTKIRKRNNANKKSLFTYLQIAIPLKVETEQVLL